MIVVRKYSDFLVYIFYPAQMIVGCLLIRLNIINTYFYRETAHGFDHLLLKLPTSDGYKNPENEQENDDQVLLKDY